MKIDSVNYAKLDWKATQHGLRYKKRVEAMSRKLVCQECRGLSGYIEIIDSELGGPWYPCGWCRGTGFVTPYDRGLWLRYRKHG